MRHRHSRGDMLTVFQDPYTRKQREGFARLAKFIRDEGDGYETWKVRFTIDNDKMPLEFEETIHERIIQP